MIKLAVCDDDSIYIERIQILVNQVLNNKHLIFSVDTFLSGEALCNSLEMGSVYDIVFLDIQMSGISGVDAGVKLRQYLEKTILIYISSFDYRAKEVFCINAHRFLSKPIEPPLFEEALLSACDLLETPPEKVFSFSCPEGLVKLPLNHILYFEVSQSHRVDVVTDKCRYTFYGKLTDVQAQLSADDFLRIHQSHLINYNYIKNITYENVIMKNGVLLWIGGPRRKETRNAYREIKQRRNSKWL